MTWVPPLTLLARYLIAFVVASHGIVYIGFGIESGKVSAGWRGNSLLLGNAITGDMLETLVIALWAIAGVGFIATGAAIAFSPSLQGLLRPLAIGTSLVGILSFAAFWDGQTRLFASQGGIGMVLSTIILVSAMAFP